MQLLEEKPKVLLAFILFIPFICYFRSKKKESTYFIYFDNLVKPYTIKMSTFNTINIRNAI